jgi:hypothetical protein
MQVIRGWISDSEANGWFGDEAGLGRGICQTVWGIVVENLAECGFVGGGHGSSSGWKGGRVLMCSTVVDCL